MMTEKEIRAAASRINGEAIRLNAEAERLHKECLALQAQARSLEAQYGALRTLLRECHGKDFGNTGTFPFQEDVQA